MSAYNSIHTGPDIDSSITRTMGGMGGTNRNLLDNWYFLNPANQKGLTNYSGAAGTYTIDRWQITNAGTEVTIIGAGVQIVAEVGYTPYLRQIIERPEDLLGKKVTLSVLDADGDLKTASTTLPTAFPVADTLYCNVTDYCDILATSSSLSVRLKGAPDDGRAFAAVKLELGENQTLAHMESGVWVLNEIPDFAVELAKCQRFFLKLNNFVRYPSTRIASGEIDFLVPVPVTFRAAPQLSGTCTVYSGTSAATGFTFTNTATSSNAISIRASKTSHGLSGGGIYLTVNGVELDANL